MEERVLIDISKSFVPLPDEGQRFLSDNSISYLKERGISVEVARKFGLFSVITNFPIKGGGWLNHREGIALPNSKYTGNIRLCDNQIKGFTKYTKVPTNDGEEHPHLPFGAVEFFIDKDSGSPLQPQPQWIFITESEIDGLSILENDSTFPILSIGGVGCMNKVFQLLNVRGMGLPPFIICCFDRDEAGVDCYTKFCTLLELNHYKGRVMNFWDYVDERCYSDDKKPVKDLNDYWVKFPTEFITTLTEIKSYKQKSILRDEVNQPTPVTVTSLSGYVGEGKVPQYSEPVKSTHPTFDGRENDVFSSFAPTSTNKGGEVKDEEQPQPMNESKNEDIKNDDDESTEVEVEELTNTNIQELTEGGRRYLEFKNKYGGKSLIKRMREFQQNPRPVLSTPFPSLNIEMNGGFRTGLHFIGGSTGIGKTSFLLRLSEHFIRNGFDVIYYTFEVEREQIGARIVSHLSYDKYGDDGFTNLEILEEQKCNPYGDMVRMSEWDIQKVDEVMDEYERVYSEHIDVVDVSTFEVDETPTISLIYNQVKDVWEQTKKPPIVFIDYLQLIQPESGILNSSDKQIVDFAVRKLKQLSVLTGGYIFAVTSLNRNSYDETPSEKSSKESGLIEYMGDTLTILSFIDGSGGKLSPDEIIELRYSDEKDIYLHLLKNRNGKGRVITTLHNHSKFGEFKDGGLWKKEVLPQQPSSSTTTTPTSTNTNIFDEDEEREKRKRDKKNKYRTSHYSN